MKNIPSAVGSALQNKDEELHFLFYSLLNQNDPQEMVVVQALLNPGNCPMIVFKDKYPTHISIPPQLLGMIPKILDNLNRKNSIFLTPLN